MDVGGGYGELLAQILLAIPRQPVCCSTCPMRSPARARSGRPRRCRALRIRCRRLLRQRAIRRDLYVLKTVIHDWPDEKAREILQHCRQAMAPVARLLVIERLMPERLKPSADHRALARVDLHMLVALGAQERTAAQMLQLLQRRVLNQVRLIELPLASSRSSKRRPIRRMV